MTSSMVIALIVPVAPEDVPVIVSPTVNVSDFATKLNGLVVVIILPFALEVPPVIVSSCEVPSVTCHR